MKLFILIFCGILLCVASLGIFSYNKSKSIIESKISEASQETAAQTAGRIDLLLTNYERKTMEFLSDQEFMSLLSTTLSTSDDYERFDSQRTLATKLSTIMLSDNMLSGIYLLPTVAGGEVIGTSPSGGMPDFSESLPSFTQKMLEASGRVVWVPTMTSGISGKLGVQTIAVGRALMNVGSGTTPYLLVMEINLNTLRTVLDTVKFGDGSQTYIVADDGTNVLSANEDELAQPYKYELPGDSGSTKIKVNGKDTLSVMSGMTTAPWKVVGDIPVSTLVKAAGAIRTLTIVMCIVSALIAATIGLLILWTIGRPLGQLRTLMNEGERGNLTVRSRIKRADEIGQVSDSFNRMMEQITGLVMQTTASAAEVLATSASLSDASHKTAGSAKEIAIATEEIASGATNLAVESERGSEMTGHIGEQVQTVISANDEMGRSASEVEEASRKGTGYMTALMDKTSQTEEMTRSMVEKVDKLKDSTGSIRKILEVLGNLTKQTNILSLNATIEAARAGAAGKGFMVVADEIRKLADQSRHSIGVVGEVVQTIQREIDETVHVLSDAYPLFQAQIDSVRDANAIFQSVQNQMGGFVQKLESTTESINQLEGAQSTLSLAMTNVSAVAQEASATSEQVASLSNEQLNVSEGLVQLSNRLEQVSKELKESLSRFTVA
ncbi:methyl-accepting chemotaxis protein [Cohnella fermenti]|uniref:Methyl-accepting chemotaxis protein n=2 Tax=Cohnella fermenti TaxID=2565925 RepID=A0A4S4C338_9BACL|nr:methyl-accepting chemotaxis protein [Cohnella fermenti]